MKTLKAWEALDDNDGETPVLITDYLQPGDEIDEAMFLHFAEVIVPKYHNRNLLQAGEAEFEGEGRYHYLTFAGYDRPDGGTRYLYIGILPPFKQPK